MPSEHTEQIETVVVDVLEQMAFMFADVAEQDEMPEVPEEPVQVTVGFSGFCRGALSIWTSGAVCRELAANLLGDDGDDPVAGRQAMAELTNVVCGRLLTEVAGNDPVFDLSAPVIADVDAAAWSRATGDDTAACFLTDDQPLVVRFEYLGAA